MEAVGNNILVKMVDEGDDNKIGSLYVPNTHSNTILKGKVVSMGDRVYKTPHGKTYSQELFIDDIVLFYNAGNAIPITVKGEDHLIITIENILVKE
jgi:co-chaperonin GroES (HSP10)